MLLHSGLIRGGKRVNFFTQSLTYGFRNLCNFKLQSLSQEGNRHFASATGHGTLADARTHETTKRVYCPAVKLSGEDAIASIGTPSLILDLDAVDRNISTMHKALASWVDGQKHFTGEGEKAVVRSKIVRPHFKALKSRSFLEYALKKSDSKITPHGVCCQTVHEAEVAKKAGCRDILLTNQIFSKQKMERLTALLDPNVKVSCLIDDVAVLSLLSECLQKRKEHLSLPLGIFIEIDGGQGRCGVDSQGLEGERTLAEMVTAIDAKKPFLKLRGIHCYHGLNQHVRKAKEKRDRVMEGPVARGKESIAAIKKAGVLSETEISNLIVTGGGTGTFMYELEGGVHTEVQPGSYLVMDFDYEQNEPMKDLQGSPIVFANALYVHATVISVKGSKRVIDAGSKAVDLFSGKPRIASLFDSVLARKLKEGRKDVEWQLGGDEHGILLNVEEGLLPLGSTIQLVPSHCDPTVNLHDFYVCVRKEKGGRQADMWAIQDVWEIDARGPAL